MIPRQYMFDTIRRIFERFGFLPLDTPGIEKEDILTGGDPAFSKSIFRTSATGSRYEGLAMRFDLTVPLARVVASYPNDISRPFKRYQVGKVWRGEKPQAGRFREFVQFDADIVGARTSMADAEIISLMYETMTALGFSEFVIRVNNRKILNGLPAYAGFPVDRNEAVLRAIDKMGKIDWKGVSEELGREPGDGDDSGVGLEGPAIEAIRRFIELQGGSSRETLAAVQKLMVDSPQAMEGITELLEIIEHVEALGVPEDRWAIDLSVARGLGYYTGPVFETILTNLPSIGSVFSGGRYDDLVARFSSGSLPATGASVGVDRLFAAMEMLEIIPSVTTISKVMVLNFDVDCQYLIQKIVSSLRSENIPAEVYLGGEATLKAQLSFAVKQGVPYILIIGGNERRSGRAQLKDTVQRTQVEVMFEELPFVLRSLLTGK
jgi:histidyl-tRNA synthetase